jgi:dihydrofolate reductase
MRKITVNSFLSLDGVLQAPGGPGEDTSGHFKFGGWSVHYWNEAVGRYMDELYKQPYDLLLGRKTYNIFAGYWPFKDNEMGRQFTKANKYVATHTLQSAAWENTTLLNKDTIQQVRDLKAQQGIDLLIYGSASFVQSLLAEKLVDELNIWTFPLLLGQGKRLFDGHAAPCNLEMTAHSVFSTGLTFAQYRPAGNIVTGSFDDDGPSTQGQ